MPHDPREPHFIPLSQRADGRSKESRDSRNGARIGEKKRPRISIEELAAEEGVLTPEEFTRRRQAPPIRTETFGEPKQFDPILSMQEEAQKRQQRIDEAGRFPGVSALGGLHDFAWNRFIDPVVGQLGQVAFPQGEQAEVAQQLRREGMGPIEAGQRALEDRGIGRFGPKAGALEGLDLPRFLLELAVPPLSLLPEARLAQLGAKAVPGLAQAGGRGIAKAAQAGERAIGRPVLPATRRAVAARPAGAAEEGAEVVRGLEDAAGLRAVQASPPSRTPPPVKPPSPPTDLAAVPDDIPSRLSALIRDAKRVKFESEIIKKGEFQRRVATFSKMFEEAETAQDMLRAQGALRGELPSIAEFESPLVRGLSSEEFSQLARQIREHFGRETLTSLRGVTALEKAVNGVVPTFGEIELLEKVFPDVATALVAQMPRSTKFWNNVQNAITLPKAVRSSFDLSASLRQGGFLMTGHPTAWRNSFNAQVKSLVSDSRYRDVIASVREHPDYDVLFRSGLADTFPGGGASLGKREEFFASQWAEKIPGVKQSERAFLAMTNKLRWDVGYDQIATWRAVGKEPTKREVRSLTRYLNWATGRADVLRFDNQALQLIFWAPRFAISRVIPPGALLPFSPGIRGMIAKDTALFLSSRLALLAVPVMLGVARTEIDPRSSDFLKLIIGSRRVDVWAGFQQPVRYLAQLLTGQRKPLTGRAKGRMQPVDPGETIFRFLRSKLSPVAAAGVDMWQGEDFIGRDITVGRMVEQLFIPITATEILESSSQMGLWPGVLWGDFSALPAVTGVAASELLGIGGFNLERSSQPQGRPPVPTRIPEQRPRISVEDLVGSTVP